MWLRSKYENIMSKTKDHRSSHQVTYHRPLLTRADDLIVDAHRGDEKRFVVHADEKLTAFVELESATRGLPPRHL
jgi:hypothetical protein